MTDYYSTYDLKHVINASGKMTILGVSKVPEAAIEAQQFGDTHFFEMKDLVDKTGAYIAKKLGTEGAVVVNSASAGIAEAVAGIIGEGSKYHVYHPFSSRYTKREIILPKGQNVDYGTPEHVEMMITANTAAIFYVKSHHAVQKSMLTIQEALEVAHRHELPLILDAAAEEDLHKYVEMGVDVVLFSGAKAIEGPASGLIFGKEPYIGWTKLQGLGIGRAMKIGKENLLGFTTALSQYLDQGPESGDAMKKRLHPFVAALNEVPHLNVKEVQDGAGRPIFRAAVTVEASSPKNAKQVTAELKAGDPAIYTREYRANEGIIEFDIRAVDQAEMDLIVNRLKEILA